MVKPENLGKVCTLKIRVTLWLGSLYLLHISFSLDPTTNFETANPEFFPEYYLILLIIEGCPDRVILSITIKRKILQKTLFHRFSPKFNTV